MIKKVLVALLLVLCAIAAFGQELPRIVIIPLENRTGSLTNTEVEALTDMLSTFINESLRVNVIDSIVLNATMTAQRWRMEDWADTEQTARMGRALNASFILRGSVTQMGDGLIVTARILDIQTAETRGNSNTRLEHLNEAYEKLNALAQLLTYNLGAIIPPTVPAAPPAVATPLPEPAQEQAQKPEPDNRPLQFNFTVFHLGIGMRMPIALDGSLELLKLGFEHKATGIGFGFRPFYLFGWIAREIAGNDNSVPGAIGASVINFSMYWNMMRLFNFSNKFIFGPFADFNYMIMQEDFEFDKFLFTAGIQGGMLGGEQIKFTYLSIEIGFRLIRWYDYNNDSRFFFVVKAGR